MKKTALLICAVVAVFAKASVAGTLLSDDFNTYTDGNLVGQGGWAQTSTISTTPVQVLSGAVVLGTSGQDVYDPFTSGSYTLTAGDIITTAFSLNASSAKSGGDYFLHLSDVAGGNGFYERVFAKSTTGGYLLGLAATSGTGNLTTYGSTVLSFGTTYSVSVVWSVIAGVNNDTFAISVDNASYLTGSVFAIGEPTTLAAANFRQGSTAGAAAVTIDNLSVTAISAVPEPYEYGIVMGAALIALVVVRRRKAQMSA